MEHQHNVRDLRSRGIVKLREEDMFSLWVKTACSNMTSRQLRKLADIIEKYGRSYLLFTTRQIPIIPFIHFKDVDKVQEELSQVYLSLDRCGPTVRNVNVCYDENICPEAVLGSISLAEKLDNFFHIPMTHKVKIGVAGCPKDCIISRVLTDIGFVAAERDGRKGYEVYLGGRLGVNPFVGVKMAEGLNEEESVRFVQNYFDLMKREGKGEDRAADLLTRLGVEKTRKELTRDLGAGSGLKPITCQTKIGGKATDKIILKIRATCGEVTSVQLRKIADVAEKYGKGFVHFGVRGAPEIPGIASGQVEAIRRNLLEANLPLLDRGIDNLQSCFGSYCTESNADPQNLLRRVEKLVDRLGLNDLDIKVSATGCPNSCGIAHLNDIGFMGVVEPRIEAALCNGCELCVPICKRKAIAVKGGVAVIDEEQCAHCGLCITVCPFDAIVENRRGFAALVGGREGADTRLGEKIAEFLSEDEALELAEKCLRLAKEKRANIATIIDEIGIARLKERLVASRK